MSDYSPDYARGLADGHADAEADLAGTVTDPAQGALDPAVEKVILIARDVVWFDWSDNDTDAVHAIEQLRLALSPLSSTPAQGSVNLYKESVPDDLRFMGWAVAVHNDYRINEVPHTFWLFTKGDRAIKGEGETDAEALNLVREQIHGYSLPSTGLPAAAPHAEPEDEYNPVYDEGITYAIRMLADLTGSKDWQMKDGSEDHETDVRDTIMDVLKCAGLYDDETGKFAALCSLALPQSTERGQP